MAQPGSALALGARGRWFKSSRPDKRLASRVSETDLRRYDFRPGGGWHAIYVATADHAGTKRRTNGFSRVDHAGPTIRMRLMECEREYEITLEPQADGAFLVRVPELPDVITEGRSRSEALTMAKDAIEGYLESMREEDWPVRRAERQLISVHA